MFKKLKEKITEEVKSSPQRFAEFTQSVSDRLGNNMSADENFFTIGEEDANTSVNSADHGFSSVNLVSPSQETRFRRNSNTSIASDVSFLPRYESGSLYHLQSDLDVSASEIEDNASTASQIGHLSKEQIYSAFQKSQMRYHKYRGRYTDLARHYKELERENAKMKSVLVETQDKAIRRVTELKEQCSLEQKAKAHLEAALRDEIDEKNFKIHTLQTKIGLLQGGANSDLLVNVSNKDNSQGEDLENLTKFLNEARKEIENLNERIQEMKANSIVFQSKEQEYKAKISNLEKEIAQYSEREKENNLKLAQNKMELHNEILSKDGDISNLKKDNEDLKLKLEAIEVESKANSSVKMENLQTQNKKLIDKVESLTQRCNNLESDLLKVEKYKLEIQELREIEERLNTELINYKKINEERIGLLKLVDNLNQGLASFKSSVQKLSKENIELKENLTKERKDFENQILTIREDAKKGLLSLEPRIREKLQNEYLHREEELKHDFANKIEELSSLNSSQKAVQLKLFEKEELINKINGELEALKQDLSKKVDDYNNLEKNHLELITDCTQLRNKISTLEKEKSLLENLEEKNSRLEAHIATLQEELRQNRDISEKKEKDNVYLGEENLNLQQSNRKLNEKVRILEEKLETVHLESSESKLLELKVQKLDEEKKALMDEFEVERKMFNKMLEDHKDLKQKEEEISELQEILSKSRHEVQHLGENLALEKDKNVHLYDKKHNLLVEVEKLRERVRIFEEKEEARELDKSECRMLELKLQKLEEENKNLLQSFELERLTFANELDDIKQDLTSVERSISVESSQSTDEATIDKLREKLRDIRHLSEAKEKEIVYLAEENMTLQQERDKLSKKLRLLEEKLETTQLEDTESKLLELKVQQLEEDNKKLSDEFEMERKMFNELLVDHKELKIKEEVVSQLEKTLNKFHMEKISLKESLDAEKNENLRLSKEKFDLEGDMRTLNEKVRILEEKEEISALNSNECSLLEMKLEKLETENRNMVESFETERKLFNKTYKENARNEAKVDELTQENLQFKDVIKTSKETVEKLNGLLKNKSEELKKVREENSHSLKKIKELQSRIESQDEEIQKYMEEADTAKKENMSNISRISLLAAENDKLRKELEEKDNQLSDLSKNIANLSEIIQKQTKEFNSLLERTQQLESVLEKIQTDSAEAIKKEKERQNELTSKIEDLQKELSQKTDEFASLSHRLTELEKLYAEEQNNYKEKEQEIHSLQKKIAELQAVEESYRMMGQEKQVVDNELVCLKTVENNFQALEKEKFDLENKLKRLESEFKTKNNDAVQKFKVAEQGCNLLREEKETLLVEIKNLRHKIEELTVENNNLKTVSAKITESDYAWEQLKNQNEALQSDRDSLHQEISQLNLRMNQISSDNRNIVEENQSLMHGNAELKIKIEFLENEKGEFDEIRNKLLEEKAVLAKNLDEVDQQLSSVRQQNLELVNNRNLSSSNEIDISKIQQDFYEIKEKCDSLFVENKNLKSEYAKLEEKCNDFSKVKKKLEKLISELERQCTEIQHEKQLLEDEVQELKISPLNMRSDPTSTKLDRLEILKREKAFTVDAAAASGVGHIDKETFLNEIEILQDKLTQYKSLDITNKSSIEFYENELQKMKNQNEKLNRKLDETLVTLNHCAELTNSTEVEYLKNVLYNYMLGKESLVLARVIAAVCKFDPEQTETVLQREQQKQSLLGQLGLI